MPTALSHPAVPLAIGLGAGRAAVSGPLLAAGVAASVLPDLDVIAFRLGVPYSAEFGHRGFSHSLAFAALVALVGGSCHRMLRARFLSAFAFLFAATASHGALDAFTTGGLGVAFFWPFSLERHFAPLRVIRVAPFQVGRLLSGRGVAILLSEALWVWLPCAALAAALAWTRRRGGASLPGRTGGRGAAS
ncbi:MAG TPA: metal-dependent hydrolase [Myxococcota bacterium]|jgi:inner membrane protein|nr:metal-dependent hydrolase [Myxococcota bacterium]